MNAGRPVSAAIDSMNSGVARGPVAMTKMPLLFLHQLTGKPFQLLVRGDGRGHRLAGPAAVIGRERRGEADGAGLHAPRARSLASSPAGLPSACARLEASSPITAVRMVECPASTADVGVGPSRSRASRYSAEASRTPSACPAAARRGPCPRPPTGCAAWSRACGAGHGAMPKPQLPITAVVTPSDTDGDSVGSQVTCAS